MKRTVLTLTLLLALVLSNAQVFHSAQTLKKGSFSLGIEPALLINGGEDLYIFLHGGYGIKNGIDFAMKLGVGNTNYIGADVEFGLQKNISLTVGAHSFYNFGLDGALLFNIPIRSDILLITGFDMDINFNDEVDIPLWIPVGLEIFLKKRTSLIFEVEIGLNDPAYNVIGGGLAFYF
jgi:hypothetical protein